MRRLVSVRRYETALLNGRENALHGNLELGTFVGFLMEPFAKVSYTKAGKKR